MKLNDKVKHIIGGISSAVLGAVLLHVITGAGCVHAAVCGLLCAAAAGMAAEVKDVAYHSNHIAFFDILDLLATIAGGALVAGLMLLIALWR